MLKATPKASGSRGALAGRDTSGGTILEPPENQTPTLAEIGIDKKTSSLAQRIASLPPEKIQAIAKRDSTLEDARGGEAAPPLLAGGF
jgi:hypothetical protein